MVPAVSNFLSDSRARHSARWWVSAVAAFLLVSAIALDGWSYYTLPLEKRVFLETHSRLRPSGSVGLQLGISGAFLFVLIYLYGIRKRWAWLRKKGNTAHWLDFHILMGLLAPALITLHSSFRFRGLAGMAFWIMWAVVASGVVGRYLYSLIPRHLNAAEMNLEESARMRQELLQELRKQDLISPDVLEKFAPPGRAEIESMSAFSSMVTLFLLDLKRPFQIARLRRQSMSAAMRFLSLGGLFSVGQSRLEKIVSVIREHSRLSSKVVFLTKTQKLFHLWHVVHRPFSYSLAVLIVIHVGFALALGYF